jgi:hypothetical protein
MQFAGKLSWLALGRLEGTKPARRWQPTTQFIAEYNKF